MVAGGNSLKRRAVLNVRNLDFGNDGLSLDAVKSYLVVSIDADMLSVLTTGVVTIENEGTISDAAVIVIPTTAFYSITVKFSALMISSFTPPERSSMELWLYKSRVYDGPLNILAAGKFSALLPEGAETQGMDIFTYTGFFQSGEELVLLGSRQFTAAPKIDVNLTELSLYIDRSTT